MKIAQMTTDSEGTMRRVVMATPYKTDYYRECAHALEAAGLLRHVFLWKRAGYPEVTTGRTSLWPLLGAITYGTAKLLPPDTAEAIRFSLYPWYDRWVEKQIRPGDWVYSSYGYANACFAKARRTGGRTLLDGGNSHPENFHAILSEEHERWGWRHKPLPESHYRRAVEMMEHVDYVLAPSNFVARSFLDRGFPEERVLRMFYPVDFSHFRPADEPRPTNRPFTVINTGGLSLRKGTPYLLEAFRMIHREIPGTRFLLTRTISGSARRIVREYADLPIEWEAYLPPDRLAGRLRQADLFILPSLEEGLVRTAIQAMACGLPAILTPNTGASDYIQEGINGTVVPIRSPESIARAAVFWWDRIRNGYRTPVGDLGRRLSIKAYHERIAGLVANALAESTPP